MTADGHTKHHGHDHKNRETTAKSGEAMQGEHDHAATGHGIGGDTTGRAMDHEMTDDAGHSGAHVNHSGHERMFRTRFLVSLPLSIPVLLFSRMLQRLDRATFFGADFSVRRGALPADGPA